MTTLGNGSRIGAAATTTVFLILAAVILSGSTAVVQAQGGSSQSGVSSVRVEGSTMASDAAGGLDTDRASTTTLTAEGNTEPPPDFSRQPTRPSPKPKPATSMASRPPCDAGLFKCLSDGHCINAHHVCDGAPDCPDGSDEKACPRSEGPPSAKLVIDNNSNSNSTGAADCDETEFKCSEGHCIKSEWRCDGESDCKDGSDEASCDVRTTTATDDDEAASSSSAWTISGSPTAAAAAAPTKCKLDPTEAFYCRDGQCMPKSWVCDGSKDCDDGFDEEHCEPNGHIGGDCGLAGAGPWFKCKDHANCTLMDNVCDGKPDCRDGSDESESCQWSCKGMKCQHRCKPLPDRNAGRCSCDEGHVLQPDGRSCVDVDECSMYGRCSQLCTNYKGGFFCDCAPGYHLLGSNGSCRADNRNTLILMSFRTQILGMEKSAMKPFQVFGTDEGYIIGLGYDSRAKKVVWVYRDGKVKSVSRSDLDGGHRETLPVDPMFLASPEDLEVDFVTGNIYMTDPARSAITACSSDGRACADVLRGGNSHLHSKIGPHRPRGLALNPADGIMYYTDVGHIVNLHHHGSSGGHRHHPPYIGRCGMDGKRHSVLVDADLSWPGGITVDPVSKRVFWVNAGFGTIETVKPDGTGRSVVMGNSWQHPFFLAVFENDVYWSDWKTRSFQMCDRFDHCKDHRTIRLNDDGYREKLFGQKPLGIHVFNPVMEAAAVVVVDDQGDDGKGDGKGDGKPCGRNRCSHLCLLGAGNTYTCACPPGHTAVVVRTCSPPANNSSGSGCGDPAGYLPLVTCVSDMTLHEATIKNLKTAPSSQDESVVSRIRKFFGQEPKETAAGPGGGAADEAAAAAGGPGRAVGDGGRAVAIGMGLLMVALVLGMVAWCLLKNRKKGGGKDSRPTVMRFRNQRLSVAEDHLHREDVDDDHHEWGPSQKGGLKGDNDVLLKGLHSLDDDGKHTPSRPSSRSSSARRGQSKDSSGVQGVGVLGVDADVEESHDVVDLEGQVRLGGEKPKSSKPNDDPLDPDSLVHHHMPSWRTKASLAFGGNNRYERM